MLSKDLEDVLKDEIGDSVEGGAGTISTTTEETKAVEPTTEGTKTTEESKEETKQEVTDSIEWPSQTQLETSDKTDTPKLKEAEVEIENTTEDSTEGTQATTVAETSEHSDDENSVSKYMLLDRLFKFINRKDKEPVNPVLAGYFSKVICLLINRK